MNAASQFRLRSFLLAFGLLWCFSISSVCAADPCDASEELNKEIISCGNNDLVPRYARECLAIVQKEKEEALVALQTAMASHNHVPLRRAINHMVEEIQKMQRQTATVADYASEMIDFPGSTKRETSAECFNVNFDHLQEIVSAMDDEIIGAKDALKSASDGAAGLKK